MNENQSWKLVPFLFLFLKKLDKFSHRTSIRFSLLWFRVPKHQPLPRESEVLFRVRDIGIV
jgi:hypothetical protein